MKQGEEMIRAVRDWAKRMVGEQVEGFKGDIDLDTLLRKTGDASKVTSIFSTYGSRTLPASGETLDVTIAKIRKFLSDLNTMAFSNDYDNLSYKPIRSNFLINHMATAEEYIGDSGNLTPDNAMLVYGIGGVSSSSNPRAKTDFFRAYLVAADKYDTSGTPVAKSIQLGSLGSTARWTLNPSGLYTSNGNYYCVIKIPKGSWAIVQGLRIPLYTQYASNK